MFGRVRCSKYSNPHAEEIMMSTTAFLPSLPNANAATLFSNNYLSTNYRLRQGYLFQKLDSQALSGGSARSAILHPPSIINVLREGAERFYKLSNFINSYLAHGLGRSKRESRCGSSPILAIAIAWYSNSRQPCHRHWSSNAQRLKGRQQGTTRNHKELDPYISTIAKQQTNE